MFSPNSDIEVKKIFNELGGYFNRLPASSKQKLESYWSSLIDGGEAAYYNLFSANLSQYLQYTKGHIERSYHEIPIFEESIKKIYDDPPENSTLSEVLISIPDNYKYVTLPKLTGLNNEQVYEEGTDYTIRDLNTLVFSSVPEFDYYIMDPSVAINPILSDFYIANLGGDINDIITNQEYIPFIQGWSGLTGNEKQEKYLFHIMKLIHGVISLTRKQPDISNLVHIYGLFVGYPFSYETGEVTQVTSQTITIEGDNTYTYDMGENVTFIKGVGETYQQFDLLKGVVSISDSKEYIDSGTTQPAFEEQINGRGDRTSFDLYIHDSVVEVFNEDPDKEPHKTTLS